MISMVRRSVYERYYSDVFFFESVGIFVGSVITSLLGYSLADTSPAVGIIFGFLFSGLYYVTRQKLLQHKIKRMLEKEEQKKE
jgi:hypothetical protein